MKAFFVSALGLLFLFSPLFKASAEENLLKNGDFEKGTSRWKGSRDDEELDGNKVLAVEADADEMQFFSQEIDPDDYKDLHLVFRYKSSEDYKGRGLTIRWKRPDGSSTYRSISIKAAQDWEEEEWNFDQVRGARTINFIIEVKEGEGTLYFDDFVIKGVEK